METNDTNYQQDFFREQILQSSDSDLLMVIKEKVNYDPKFIELVEEELAIRGFNLSEEDVKDIDFLILDRKDTDELVDIITNVEEYPKEWNAASRKILKTRNFDFNSLYTVSDRNIPIAKDGIQGKYIVLGYIFAVMGGLIGLFFAINYYKATVRTINDEAIPKYNASTRAHGKIMLIIAIFSFGLGILSKVI